MITTDSFFRLIFRRQGGGLGRLPEKQQAVGNECRPQQPGTFFATRVTGTHAFRKVPPGPDLYDRGEHDQGCVSPSPHPAP